MSLTGIVLDRAFRNNVESSQRENLRTQIYTLLATAELDINNQLQLPAEITEPRLNLSESSLHARVITQDNKNVWLSKSMLNTRIDFGNISRIGEFSFSNLELDHNSYTLLSFATQWLSDDGEKTYVFQIAENRNILKTQINLFRKNLWLWLAGVSFLLIIIQTIILHWGLKPLRHVAEDLLKIEKGNAKRLTDDYPKEITPLTQNLNLLLDSSSQQLTRYRDGLGNLAHSLKTPITVLQGIIDNSNIEDKNTALTQLETINNIVEYQLQRAATAGRTQLSDAIELEPIIKKILNTLEKVHKEKSVNLMLNILPRLSMKIDSGDLYELLGNLFENAFKWCNHRVIISAEGLNKKTRITIEDDGPGIKHAEKDRILLRGQRADQNTPGHGLGLAMVNDILLLYQGEMQITESDIGGAKIIITL